MIDLDRFKQLNDNYGHRTGDDALVSVARALRDTTAVIGRSGGEEFVIADIWHPDEVDLRAQQLCKVIAALPSVPPRASAPPAFILLTGQVMTTTYFSS